MRTLHVAAAQVHSGGGVAETLARIERQVAAAAAVGAQVILFSEGVLQGYDYGVNRALLDRIAEPPDGPGCAKVAAIARKYGLAVLVGFFERAAEGFYNSQFVARPDGDCAVQRKNVLNDIERNAGLVPGPAERTVFEFNGVRTAIIICADCAIDNLHERLKAQSVDYRLCPTGGGGKMEEMLHEAELLTPEGRKKYEENRPRVFKPEAILSEKDCPYVGFTSANALGPVGKNTCHQGHCMIVDNQRVMRAQIPGTIVLEHQQDQMIHAVLDF
jgi:predicted amidohydrolase